MATSIIISVMFITTGPFCGLFVFSDLLRIRATFLAQCEGAGFIQLAVIHKANVNRDMRASHRGVGFSRSLSCASFALEEFEQRNFAIYVTYFLQVYRMLCNRITPQLMSDEDLESSHCS